MQIHLFDLDFTRWDVVLTSLFPSFICIGMHFYVSLTFPDSRLNRFFCYFVLFLGIWQISEALMKLSVSAEAAAGWCRISEYAVLFVIVYGIQFILRLSGWDKNFKGNTLSTLLFVPIIVFFIMVHGGMDEIKIVKSENWYWIGNPVRSGASAIINAWSALGGLTMVFLFWAFFIKGQISELKRRQAIWLAFGITVPVVTGVLFEVILPSFFKMDDIPLSSPLITLFPITAFISIQKYKMFDYSPKHQWHQIIETMNDAVIIVNNNDEIMYANANFCKTMGYEFWELEGKVAAHLFLEEKERERILKVIGERKNGKTSKYEVQMIKKDGEKIWMMISGSPYYDQKGEVIGSIGIQTNITAIKSAKEILESSEARLKQAQSIAHVGSWEVNFATGRSLWSDEACRIYGLDFLEKGSHTFESWFAFIHPEDKEFVKKEIDRSGSTMSDSSFKHRIVRMDGSIRHIHSMAKFEFNAQGQPKGLVGICHDITEQIKAEAALMESENKLSKFIDDSLLAIYTINPLTRKVVYANAALTELLGYTREELNDVSIYDFINHSEENINARIREVIENKKLSTGEREWIRKDGSVVNVLVSSVYEETGSGAIFVAAQNISDRKKAEENLKAINNELETFIYKASHDLRGPLASMMGLMNIGRMEIEDQTALKYMSMLSEAGRKLDHTLTELVKSMSIKNINSFTDEIHFEQIVDHVLNNFLHFDGFTRLKISKDISVSGPFVSNKYIVETILQNLIENAIKYQRLDVTRPELKINISENDERVKIIIADNGIGMEADIQSRVFDMYFRGTDISKGSGLGLYLVKKGTDKLNGRLELKSEKNKGTAFTLLLNKKKCCTKQNDVLVFK